MSNPQQPDSVFNSKFVLTIVLVFAAWMGWQSYMTKKYPDTYKKATPATQEAAQENVAGVQPADSATPKDMAKKAEGQIAGIKNADQKLENEKILTFNDETWDVEISSAGLSVKNLKLKKYTDRKGQPIVFSSITTQGLFATSFTGRTTPIYFDIKQTSANEYVGTAHVDGMLVTKILQIDSSRYVISNQVQVDHLSTSFTGLSTNFAEEITAPKSSSFLMPSFEHQEFYVSHEGTDSRLAVDAKSEKSETYKQAKIAGFGSQYFAVAIVDRSPTIPDFKASSRKDHDGRSLAMGSLIYSPMDRANSFLLKYDTFAGPKSFELLKTVDAEMTNLINFGFFKSIAKGIFWLMKSIHNAIGNWGIAIIFLTILVRIVVLPFNMIGYRQMKAMSKIQPKMKELRERYKNDAQKLNQEMLALMKNAKANPLGGCLPMFVQIPVFFALYQVIGQSIELYQAPFLFWIHDLSLKDPFYVLPALMGITMFFQQKITPSTLEPAQQKIMNIMPVFFTFLMISLPSGLTLYIFISSIFGVLQQFYFMKDKKPAIAQA